MSDNWLLGPVGRCIPYLAEEIAYASLLNRSLVTLTGFRTFLAVAKPQLENAGASLVAIDKLAAESQWLEAAAQEQVNAGFSAVHRHSLVGLWSSIEATMEDTVVLILERCNEAEQMADSAGYKIKKRPLTSLAPAELHRLYRSLESQARQGRNVAESYQSLLGAFGVRCSLKPEVVTKMVEANAVRNCILHRGAVIDGSAVAEAPALAVYLGKEFQVTSALYLEYYDAISGFVQALLTGVITSTHMQWKQGGH